MSKPKSLEGYLSALRVALYRQLPNEQDRVDRILSETEDHLSEAARRNRDAGVSLQEAESQAIQQFGSPTAVARKFGVELAPPLSIPSLALRAYLYLASLAGAVLVAVAATALLTGTLWFFFGAKYASGFETPVVDVPPVSAQECADLMEAFGAPDCATAQAEWAGGMAALSLQVGFLLAVFAFLAVIALGLAGVLIWGAHTWLRRRLFGPRVDHSLPGRAYPVLGALIFGLGVLLFLPAGVIQAFAQPSEGADLQLSAGLVSTVLFLLYARSIHGLKLPFVASA